MTAPAPLATRAAPPRRGAALGAWLLRAAAVLRRIIGAPDYEAYLAHMARRHPERTPLTQRQYEQRCLTDRYSRPGSRCC